MMLWGSAKGKEEFLSVGFVLTMFVVLFGWLLLGLSAPAGGTATTKITAKVLYDGEVIHLSQGGDIITTFRDVHTYHLLADKAETIAIGTYKLNMYGGSCTGTNWTIPE